MLTKVLKMVATHVKGNAYCDHELWNLCYEIAFDSEAQMEYRLIAMAKMNEITGVDDPITPEALADLMSQCGQ